MKNYYLNRVWSLFLLLLLVPALGHAQPNSTRVYKIVDRYTGRALTTAYGMRDHHEPGLLTQITDYTGSASQQWKFMPSRANGSGVYEIINRSSGQVLSVDPQGTYYEGKYVVQNYRTGVVNGVQTNNWQLWQLRRLTTVSSISYEITLRATNTLLTRSPGYITEHRPEPDPSMYGQVWDLVDVSENTTSNPDLGVYAILNLRSTQVLGANTTYYSYGTEVVQNPERGVADQEWTFIPASTPGYYRIINRTFRWALEIGGGDLQYLYNQGRQANLWNDWNGPNQQWGLFDVYDGHLLTLAEASDGRPCILINRHTGQCLEMGGGGNYPMQQGRTPNQWPYLGTTNQIWVIQYRTANRNPLSTGVATSQASSTKEILNLFPNPAQTSVNLALPDGTKLTSVSVFDLRGARKKEANYQGYGKLDIADLAPGIYMVSASDGTRTYRQKLVKN